MSGKPLIALLHGWGMNAHVFDPLVDALADAVEVRRLHLPGHGGRAGLPANTLRDWADDVAAQLPDGTTLVGWSLGGQVALRAALDHPHKVARLVLLASTPRFVAGRGWGHAMQREDLEAFGASLLADPASTLLRFLSLQTRGMTGQKALLQRLRHTVLAAPAADADALTAGLALLRDADLRAEVGRIAQPVLVVHGALDTLTPAAAGRWLAQALPDARAVELPRAAHAPHLSHPQEVAAAVREFVHD